MCETYQRYKMDATANEFCKVYLIISQKKFTALIEVLLFYS